MDEAIDCGSTAARSKGRGAVWTGRIISGFVVLFMLFDSITKITKNPHVIKASATPVIGMILFACIIFYVIPRTSVIGAVLLTGYLGGAVATNLRIGAPLFSNILFPVYFGILVWAGLYLRNRRVREMFSVKKGQ